MESFEENAQKALECVVCVIKKRLEKINELSDYNLEETLKMIKNDELIKLANFVLDLIQKSESKENEDEEKQDNEIRLMVDREIKDWAK